MSFFAFLNTIEPGIAITTGFTIYIVVILFILGFRFSKKAKIGTVIALTIFLLGINIFVSWLDWNSRQNHQNIFALATSGTLALYDPLKDASNNRWIESPNCKYTRGAYHVSSSQKGIFNICPALSTSFKNFTYQVRIIIIRGDDGCLVFRIDITSKEKEYEFCIGSNGSYILLAKKPNTNYLTYLQQGFNPAITTGLNQVNSIAVVAHGTELDMYVNTLFVSTVNDDTSVQGFIGLGAFDRSSSSEVAFSNAQVWTP